MLDYYSLKKFRKDDYCFVENNSNKNYFLCLNKFLYETKPIIDRFPFNKK